MNEGTLFQNIDSKKRYYGDIYEEKIDGTKKIKRLLNEEYLLKNDDDNDEKCCTELDFKDLKNETIYERNEDIIEQLNKADLFNITNRRLIKMITDKMKNEDVRSCKSCSMGRNISYIENSISELFNKNNNLHWNNTIPYERRNKSIN